MDFIVEELRSRKFVKIFLNSTQTIEYW